VKGVVIKQHVDETNAFGIALGVNQYFTKVIALQWIFAFAIMATLFVLTLAVAIPGIFGVRFGIERGEARIVDEDRERQPLLDDR
jgi:Fungal protein of unknown function (DUF1774)